MRDDDFGQTLRAAARGDEAAFTQLFRLTQPALLRYLYSLAGASLAEDIASDTWVSVTRDLGGFTGSEASDFRAWVLHIARRRWIDEVRRRARRPELPVEEFPVLAAADDVPEQAAAAGGTDRAIALLRTLPREQAEVVLLRVVAGLDVAATAEIVGKSPGAVRVIAHRAIKRLAALVEAQDARSVTNSGPSAVES